MQRAFVQFIRASRSFSTEAAKKEITIVPRYPCYQIRRTATGRLPVYTDYHGNQPLTVIRNVNGNLKAFLTDIRRLVGPNIRVDAKPTGVTIAGNFAASLRRWLRSVGH